MNIKGLFVGIDQHLDENIKDLSCAKRDASAMWALFTDTINDGQFELLADSQATRDHVQVEIQNLLSAAQEDDVVVLSFSGHGTNDHRLVMHDTLIDNLVNTTITMSALADLFRSSKAGVILLVLDCCFSGGATAKVLSGTPVPRGSLTPIADLSGEGRVIISACDEHSPAYELPRLNHGLLTDAFIRAFTESDGPIAVIAAMNTIMDRVRSEAGKAGVTQNATMLGSITGGLTFPVLQKGDAYRDLFPLLSDISISGAIDELAQFKIDSLIIEHWKRIYPNGLNQLQKNAVNDYGLLSGHSLFVAAPTSSGKTFIGEMSAVKAACQGQRAVFLFPYRALVGEKYDHFKMAYEETSGLRVIRCTGDYSDETSAFVNGKYDIAVLTYEMFLSLVLSHEGTLENLSCVVLDEAHFISDPNRGIVVELILTHILRQQKRGLVPQLIALSAVVGDLNGFDDWVGSGKLISTQRPVPLTEGVLGRDGVFQYLDPDGNVGQTQLIPAHSVVQRRRKPGSQDVVVPLVRHLTGLRDNEHVLVFRNNRGSAKGCANYLGEDLGIAPCTTVVESLPTGDESTASRDLRRCLNAGTAFHTSDLDRHERSVIESAYRDPGSGLRILAATTTVAAGVNTPASTVVIVETYFYSDAGQQPFSVAEYKNMAGRAGRVGFNEAGQSILIASTARERQQLFDQYVMQSPEPIRSSFDESELSTWVIKLLAQIGQVDKADLGKLIASSYGGFLRERSSPGFQESIGPAIDEIIEEMVRLSIVHAEHELVSLTSLGHAVGKSSLRISSVLRLLSIVDTNEEIVETPEGLLAITLMLHECDQIYVPLQRKGTAEKQWLQRVVRSVNTSLGRLFQRFVEDEWVPHSRAKKQMILTAWVSGLSIESIEQNYSVNAYSAVGAGNIRGLADAVRFHLRSVFDILSLSNPGNIVSGTEVDDFLRQLELGVPKSLVPIANAADGITRAELLQIAANSADLTAVSLDELRAVVGVDRAAEIYHELNLSTDNE